ncbi:hypothetical protein M501DRAFT_1027931 [Patellaria atrata CBS 101060]|uniref:Uncharacterized protein n=1 Tax=Patellaria atrata CBS 101060 TaxID=1346257 RepID=A0A9P4SIF5_9PEZI|nr:hypothetical protein M501DRAFT_1027931 [Patellaria atrata CBS 101060]
MTTKDSSLYGIPRPKDASKKEISSSTTLSFTSQLSSLIASSSASSLRSGPTPTSGRPRAKKEDIFATHNKNARKRALKDLEGSDYTVQKHSTSSEALDDVTWHRSKRKMEEKARLYAAMKRGDVEDVDEKYAVDFDRKWAEKQEARQDTSSDDGEDDEGDEDFVEYTDEFGRTRKGTKAEAVREERKKKVAVDEADRFTARPTAPQNVIFGDTIQSGAFNPDDNIARQMEELAKKRDREATPPREEHFDSGKEVRTKGVGFFQFSGDAEIRKKEMENLEKERVETERARKEREQKKEERKREIAERRKLIIAKATRKRADKFLESMQQFLAGRQEENDGVSPIPDTLTQDEEGGL